MTSFYSSNHWSEIFIQSAHHGQQDKMQMSLQNGANINSKDVLKNSALEISASHGHIECLSFLLNQMNVDLFSDTSPYHEFPALEAATRAGHAGCVSLLVQAVQSQLQSYYINGLPNILLRYSEPSSQCKNTTRKPHQLSDYSSSSLSSSQSMNDHSCEPFQHVQRTTPIHIAARYGHVGCLKELLAGPIDVVGDVNQLDDNNMTALMLAIKNNHIDCILTLLCVPTIDISIRNPVTHSNAILLAASTTPLSTRAYDCLSQMMHSLIRNKAHFVDHKKNTIHMIAAKRGNDLILRLVRTAFPQLHRDFVNGHDQKGQTALMLAVIHSKLNCIDELLQLKLVNTTLVSISSQNTTLSSPLSSATAVRHQPHPQRPSCIVHKDTASMGNVISYHGGALKSSCFGTGSAPRRSFDSCINAINDSPDIFAHYCSTSAKSRSEHSHEHFNAIISRTIASTRQPAGPFTPTDLLGPDEGTLDITAVDNNGFSAVHHAALRNNVSSLVALLQADPSNITGYLTQQTSMSQHNILMCALRPQVVDHSNFHHRCQCQYCFEQRTDTVDWLLQQPSITSCLQQVDSNGQTFLYYACMYPTNLSLLERVLCGLMDL